MPAVNESSESCSALHAYKAFARLGKLIGDESLEVDDVGIGLDGAENIGHVSGDVGLGFSELDKSPDIFFGFNREFGRLTLITSRSGSLELRLFMLER